MAKASPSPSRYRAAGYAKDGTTILVPKAKPDHFTRSEIRDTIKRVGRSGSTGQFVTKGEREPPSTKR